MDASLWRARKKTVMNQHQPSFEDAIRKSLDELSVKAPPSAWPEIASRIEPKRSLRPVYWWAAASLLIVVLLSVWFMTPDSSSQLAENSKQTSVSDQRKESLPTDTNAMMSAESEVNHSVQSTSSGEKNTSNKPMNADTDKQSSTTELKSKNSQQYPSSNSKESQLNRVLSNPEAVQTLPASREDDFAMASNHQRENSISLHKADAISLNQAGLNLGTDSENRAIISSSDAALPERSYYLPGLAETSTDHDDEPSHWFVSGGASPLYSFRDSRGGAGNELFEATGGLDNLAHEIPLIAYTGGVQMSYEKDRWNVSTGVYYAQQGQMIDQVNVSKVTINNSAVIYMASTSMGNVQFSGGKSPVQLSSLNNAEQTDNTVLASDPQAIDGVLTQTYETLEMPLMASYRLNNHKLKVSVVGGVSVAYRLSDRTWLNYQNEVFNLQDVDAVRTTTFQSLTGVDFRYPITGRLFFNLQPIVRYGLNSINPDFVVVHIPYSFSVYTGFSVRF